MGKLVQLEVNNFKSYRGHHTLLFGDAYFTSVVGPNGSGKSNSMDAISFCLGIKSSSLRSSNLRDLIYRGRVIRTARINADGDATEANGDANGGNDEDGDAQPSSQRNDPKEAWVKAVFEDDSEQKYEWKRTVTSAGASEYRINNRQVSQKEYNEALEEHGILVKARNFLVFQGDVERVAQQPPHELTRMVEIISGSIELKNDYERLKAESEEATEEQTQQLGQRRQINAELRTYEQQKKEAEAYEEKVEERDNAVVEHVLWKLFTFQQTIQQSSDEIAKYQEEEQEHRRGVEKYQRRLEETIQAEAKTRKELRKTDKAIKSQEKEIEETERSLDPIDTQVKKLQDDRELFENRLADLEKQRETETQEVQKFKKDLATTQKAEKKWEDDYKAAAQEEGRELSDQDIQEYSRLRADVTKQTHANQIEINKLQRQVQTENVTAKSLKEKMEGAESSIQRLENDLTELQSKQNGLKSRAKNLDEERRAKAKVADKTNSDRTEAEKKRIEWNQMIQATLRDLKDAEGSLLQDAKEESARRAVRALKDTFPGHVYGTYVELCRPLVNKYETAITTLLGWQLDHIIVDTERTAHDCLSYAKSQRLGRFTFIPLDTITIKAINQNLKGMHPKMKLAIDCIQYENRFERAMQSAFGDSIICDDEKTMKHLCFDKKLRVRAVDLNGTIISKGGSMTGGSVARERGKSKFAAGQADNLRKKLDNLESQLRSLPKPEKLAGEEMQLRTEMLEVQNRLTEAQDELDALKRNAADKQKELDAAKRTFKELRPKYQEAAGRLESLQAKLQEYQDDVNLIADQVFVSFCQRLGYGDIRQYEAQQGTVQQERAAERLKFSKQRNLLQNAIAHRENVLKSTSDRITGVEDEISRNEKLAERLDTQKQQLQNQMDELTATLETLTEKRNELQSTLSDRTALVSEARREVDERSGAVKEIESAVNVLQANIKRAAALRYGQLRECRMEEIKIPLVEGSTSLHDLPMGEGIGTRDPDAMDVDDDPDATQIGQPEIDDYGIDVDFEALDDELREDLTPATETRLTERIATLTAEIEKLNPNMRARERLRATQDRLQNTQREWEDTRKAAERKKKAFETVKQKRMDLFTKAFNHISENIGGTYKDLTKSPQFPLGGQAYLDMEDSNEPYMAGLKYHAMPPLKRFRDMEHLSGGEKTIAALALLFAVHSYQPSPFFVLDEVDAALDTVNVGRVARYVKDHASPGMQFIVISLKSDFYQESESLVGIMRDQKQMTSRAVSLDLRKYQPS